MKQYRVESREVGECYPRSTFYIYVFEDGDILSEETLPNYFYNEPVIVPIGTKFGMLYDGDRFTFPEGTYKRMLNGTVIADTVEELLDIIDNSWPSDDGDSLSVSRDPE